MSIPNLYINRIYTKAAKSSFLITCYLSISNEKKNEGKTKLNKFGGKTPSPRKGLISL